MTDEPRNPRVERSGLCASCVHLRLLRSARGSLFFLCRRSETDARFARYPPIPVRSCPGHEPLAPGRDATPAPGA